MRRDGWKQNPESPAAGGWVSSFADVTTIHGSGTAEELETYMQSETYLTDDSPYVVAALVFDSFGEDGSWDYTIRLNATQMLQDVPTTTSNPVNYLQTEVEMSSTNKYMSEPGSEADGPSFIALQLLVDRYIIQSKIQHVDDRKAIEDHSLDTLCPGRDCPQLAAPLKFHPYNVIFTPLPFVPITKNSFYELVADYLALVFLTIYLYSVYNASQTFILEKETRVREALRMQGVGNCTLVTSWFVTLGVQYFVMALLMTVASKISLFQQADIVLLMFGYWISLISFMAFAWAIHTIFNQASIGGLFTIIAFAGGYLLFRMLKSNSNSEIIRFIIQLHPASACCFLIQNLALLEGNGLGVTWASLLTPLNGGFTFGGSLVMLVFDTLLLTVLGWYLDLVLPKEFGTRLGPCFFCHTAYWCRVTADVPVRVVTPLAPGDASCEQASAAETKTELEGRCIAIRGFHRQFNSPDGDVAAVSDLNVTMYEGQIFCLLGHNGAGKTTVINMLSGIYEPTSGDAHIYGKSVSAEMLEIRKSMGNCFQHDVLYPTLSVWQHLIMYAGLKGIRPDAIDAAVTDIVQHVGLVEKLHVQSSALSGGMRRKLSLSIALIGDPQVVYLDEPTSGMDPWSRRATWSMLQQSRAGRVMVLTTHFMEEADLLGDRIGIMVGGKLRCCGSSMFLKRAYGEGYNLVLEVSDKCEDKGLRIKTIVQRNVPTSVLQPSVGKEVFYNLPLAGTSQFPELFKQLDAEKHSVVSYGVSVTTMEQVFVKILAQSNPDPEQSTVRDIAIDLDIRGEDNIFDGADRVCTRQSTGRCFKQVLALYLKRLHYGKRDMSSVICSTVIPVLLLVIGLLILKQSLNETSAPSLKLDYESSFGSAWDTVVPFYTTMRPSMGSVNLGTSGWPLGNAIERVEGAEPWQPTSATFGLVHGIEYTDGCPMAHADPDRTDIPKCKNFDLDLTYLTLCEVQVFSCEDCEGNDHNIAKGKPAFQSSTGWDGLADLAVDGILDSSFFSGSCSHTSGKTVTVSLDGLRSGTEYRLQLMFYENCSLRGFDVMVNGKLIVKEFSPQLEQGGMRGGGRPGASIQYEFMASSDTLMIQLDGNHANFMDTNPILNAFTLEVTSSMIRKPDDLNPIVTPGAFTGADAGEGLDFSGEFLYAVNVGGRGGMHVGDALFTDENVSGLSITAGSTYEFWEDKPELGDSADDNALETLMHSSKYSRTGVSDSTSWWQVDLQEHTTINAVDITHRTDCCTSRLIGAKVFVSTGTDFTSTGTQCTGAIHVDTTTLPERIVCPNVTGRFVTVLLEGKKTHLAGPTFALAQDILGAGEFSSTNSVIFGAMLAGDASLSASILINTTAVHAAPIFLNALSNGFANKDSKQILVRNEPLPTTFDQKQVLDMLGNIIAVLFIIIAFSFIPGVRTPVLSLDRARRLI